MTLHYVSLFSGIEAFSVAASRIADVDWRPVFFSEIDPFPCAVLAHRFPSVPNLGDVTKIRVEERDNPTTNTKEKVITNGIATVPFPRMGIDILAGGSPCQDVSVAGLRKGMRQGSATRSSLAFEYARLVEELRPRIILWENVPGVLSADAGLSFYDFLNSLVERGYCCAWRVLDAQFTRTQSFPFAVPQRRRRVWLVGCLGTDESVPAQILSLVEGVRGDPPPRREAGKGFACPVGYRATGNDRVVDFTRACGNGQLNQVEPEEVAKTLDTMHDAQIVCIGKEGYNIGEAGQGSLNISEDGTAQTVRADTHPSAIAVATFENHAQDSRVKEIEVSDTRSQKDGTGGNNLPLVVASSATFGKTGHAVNATGDGEKYAPVDVAQTLNTFQNQSDARAVDLVVAIDVNKLCKSGQAVAVGCDRRNQTGADEVLPAHQSTVSDGGSTVAVGVDAYNQSTTGGASKPLGHSATDTDHTPAVIQQINTILENNHADATETNPGEVLRVLRSAIGEKAFEGWAARVAASLRSAQILQQGLLQLVLRASAQDGCEMDDGPLPCEEDCSAGAVRDLREAERDGRPPQGRELPQQRAGESDSPVPQLPHQDASQAEGVQDLWRTDEGARVLREALSALQEIRRSVSVEKKPAYANLTHIVRRLTPVEAERLQGFPDGWTRIPYRGKPADECPDSPRYKALGNSWATNCAEYILRRIVAAFRLDMIEEASE